jgi:DNA-nicking Smr family endonuclease
MTGPGIVTADLHGRTAYQARVTVDALLRRAGRGVYRIRLIHGCHGGTALRDFLRAEYGARPGVLRVETSPDGGVTELVVREYVDFKKRK